MNNNPIKALFHATGKRFYIISLKFENKLHVIRQHLIAALSASFITGRGGGYSTFLAIDVSLVPIHWWDWVRRATYILYACMT